MDPIAHVAFGRLLGVFATPHVARIVDPAAEPRGLTAAVVLGALSLDIDLMAAPAGWDRYLAWHEFLTHSLLGTVVPAVGAALVVVGAVRRPRARFGALVAAATLGALSHLVLDLVSGGTSQLLWPLLGTRLSLPLTGMADPLLGVPLGLFLVASLVRRSWARRLAGPALVAVLAVLAVKGLACAVAHRVVRTYIDPTGPQLLEAKWASIRGWRFFDRHEATLRAWDVTIWPASAALDFSRSIPAETPEAAASRDFDTVAHFDAVFDLGFHRQTRRGGRTTVLWSDIRLCGPDQCALWFGGEFDLAGRPLGQIVLVGGWRQTRGP